MHQTKAEASRLVSGTATQTRGGRTRCHQRQGDWSDRGERCVSRPPNATPPQVAATCIWSPSDRCSYMDPGLGWYLPAGAATEASFYTLLIHAGLSSPTMKRVLIPVRALIGWRGRLIEAFDCLREEQRGQVSRAC